MSTKGAQRFAICFGVIAFAIASSASIDGDLPLALVNYGGSLFAVFLYLNPEVFIARTLAEFDVRIAQAVHVHIMWIAIAIGLLGVLNPF